MKKIIFIITAAMLSSCTKHAGDIIVNIPQATITIDTPQPNQQFAITDSIAVKGSITSTATIHGYDLWLTRANDTTTLAAIKVHDHNTTLSIDKKIKPAQPTTGNFELHVRATLDHDGHVLEKKIVIKIE